MEGRKVVHNVTRTAGAFSTMENQTVMYFLLILISMTAVIRSCIPMNPLRAFMYHKVFWNILRDHDPAKSVTDHNVNKSNVKICWNWSDHQ